MQNHENYNCHIELDDGQTFSVYANWMHNSGLDNWQGWLCDAGVTRIYIDSELDVYGGMCLNSKLGNIQTGWGLHDERVECNRPRCTGCTDDLIVSKKMKGIQ